MPGRFRCVTGGINAGEGRGPRLHRPAPGGAPAWPAHEPVVRERERCNAGTRLMSQNARSAAAYFGLPPNRVVEIGAQIQL
jgi:hypothetical protein